MKKRVLYFITAVVLVLGVVLPTAPVAASEVSATKQTIPLLPNIYYVGDTIYYEMAVSNPIGNSANNTMTRIWDTLPDGTEIEFLTGNATLVQAPGEEDLFYTDYTVAEADIVWLAALGYYGVRNRFEVEGFDTRGDDVYALVTRNSRVIRPDTEVTITASPKSVLSGGSVNLTVTEENTGWDELTNPYVEVWKNATLLATLNATTPGWSSDINADDVLDVGETWSWTISSGPITANTTFVALGFGTDPLGNEVSYPVYPGERDEETVTVTETELAALGDFVWHDLDADGIQDVGEPGIGGVTVNLYACNGTPLATTTTNGAGYYLFANLQPGEYFVEFVLPAGYFFSPQYQGGDPARDSDADPVTGRTVCVDLAAGEIDLTIDAGMYQLAALGDFVWHDLDADGIQDAGEPGMAGVTINLYACNGTPLATTSTNGTGYYLFSGLQPGEYFVEFILPGGYVFSPQYQGADPALDSNADPVTGRSACTTLTSGETDLTFDAGMYMTDLYQICGFKYWDCTMDGLAGWQIVLEKWVTSAWVTANTTITGADGSYCFTGLEAGEYRVREVLQPGWIQTLPVSPDYYEVSLPSGGGISYDFKNRYPYDYTPPEITVGWDGYSVNKMAVLAPWIALVAIMAGAVVFVRRRRAQS